MSTTTYDPSPLGNNVLAIDTWSSRNESPSFEEFDYIDIASIDREKKTIVGATLTDAADAPSRARQMVQANDVLVSTVRPNLNAVAVVPEELNGAIASTGFCVLRSHPERLCHRYLYHWVRSPFFVADMVRKATGASYPAVSDAIIRASMLPLPPLSEQKRIADILDKADSIRRKRQEAIAVVEAELLKSSFREHFGDPRTNPRGWPVEKLGDVINFVGGSQPPKDTFISEPRQGYVRLVQIRDFKTDKYPTYIPKELAKRRFVKDDVMIARYGPPVFQILRGLEGSYNVALMKAENTRRTTKDFIFYLLQTPEIHDVVVANSQRTAGQSGTNLTLLKSLEVPIPPIEKQLESVAILNSIETYHETAKRYAKEADALFNSLIQIAFKGKL